MTSAGDAGVRAELLDLERAGDAPAFRPSTMRKALEMTVAYRLRAEKAEAELAAARAEVEALRRAADPVVAYVSRCHVSRWLSGRADEERLLVAYGEDPDDAVTLTMGHLRALAAARTTGGTDAGRA